MAIINEEKTLMGIMNSLPGVELKEKHNRKFWFRIYVTDRMENMSIEDMDLGVRSYHSLKRAGYNTVGDLLEGIGKGDDLSKIRNCGAKSIREIKEKLFLIQYDSMPSHRQRAYLEEVVLLNRGR